MTAHAGDLRQALAAHLGSRQVSRVIYGSIIGLALVVTLEAHPPDTAFVVVVALAATALAVCLAELYSEILGVETQTRRRVARAEFQSMFDDVGAVAFGIAFPGVFFLAAELGLLELDAAFELAKWSGLGLIGAYGFAAARLAGAGLPRALAHALVVGAIGGLLIAIKALVH